MTDVQLEPNTAHAALRSHAENVDTLADWLNRVIDGQTPGFTPNRDIAPHEHVVHAARESATRDEVLRFSDALGVLLNRWWIDWLAHDALGRASEPDLERLRRILEMLESVPASPSTVDLLIAIFDERATRDWEPVGWDLSAQILSALSVAQDPPRRTNPESLLSLFDQNIDDPRYVAVAFTGLRRRNLVRAVNAVPRMMRAMKAGDRSPYRTLVGLWRHLEQQPDRAATLAQRIWSNKSVGERLTAISRDEIDAPRRFPAAWRKFSEISRPVDRPAMPQRARSGREAGALDALIEHLAATLSGANLLSQFYAYPPGFSADASESNETAVTLFASAFWEAGSQVPHAAVARAYSDLMERLIGAGWASSLREAAQTARTMGISHEVKGAELSVASVYGGGVLLPRPVFLRSRADDRGVAPYQPSSRATYALSAVRVSEQVGRKHVIGTVVIAGPEAEVESVTNSLWNSFHHGDDGWRASVQQVDLSDRADLSDKLKELLGS
jgi:hypothetical protein